MATGSAYGTFNPRAIEPFPIESELAKGMSEGNPTAANLLDLYQIQRGTAENQYSQEAAQQHQYAYDQLHQQLYEQNLKALAEGADKGTLGIMASSPQYQGVFGGADPGVIGQRIQQYNDMEAAKQAQAGGAGVESATIAGFQPSGDQASRLTGMTGLTNNILTPAQMKLQGDLARAAAAAKAGGEVGPTLNVKPAAIPALGGADLTASYGPKTHITSVPALVADLTKRGLISPGAPPVGGAPPEVDQDTATAPPPSKTNLPPAPRDPGGSQAPARISNNAPGAQNMQDAVKKFVDTNIPKTSPEYKDIMAKANMNGGVIQLVQDPATGKTKIQGATRTYP
jgi:hypothetical protein